MSKPYRIRVQEMIGVTDISTFQIEQIPLISPQRFAEIMADVLVEAGWTPTDENQWVGLGSEGETYVFDPGSLQIRTQLAQHQHLDQEVEGWDPGHLQHSVQEYIAAQTEQLQAELTQTLETRQQERRQQFEAWVSEATGRALKELAAELGDIQHIHEHRGEDGRYQLTISIQERD